VVITAGRSDNLAKIGVAMTDSELLLKLDHDFVADLQKRSKPLVDRGL
jgi:hypothetical protein